jgi:RNA-directed DNA polymerase
VTTASKGPEPLTAMLMEEVVRRENVLSALKQVRANKGSPGIDGMTVEELPVYLKEHWPRIREELLCGDYIPQPVKRVTIPKPGGGNRELGVPVALDRFIQQAVLQVLTPIFDPTFSPYSYGFRPRKSAHQAVEQAKKYLAEGYTWVVDCDLEKFFDRVNHDILMGRLAKRIADKRLLKLIRRYLQAGVMIHGVVQERWEGTPQGGPLSPILSNLLLDELDKELERRGHRFCRYADDSNVYVKTKRAGERVFDSIERFLEKRLKLRVHRAKSAVAPCHERGFLGFSFTKGKMLKIKLASKALRGVKYRIRVISRRSRGVSLDQMIQQLNIYLRGWVQYYRIIETSTTLPNLDSWIRRRLRCYMAKQWIKNCHTRYKNLVAMGVTGKDVRFFAASRKGPWAMSNMKPMKVAMPNRFFEELGLLSLSNQHRLVGKTS